jgi:D-alanyl-lipoteichoic acid acyltransferase DltB (MBOAT superfamily)
MIFSDARFFLIFFPLTLIIIGIVRSFQSRLLVVLTIIVISFGFYMQWRASDFAVIIASIVVNFAIANLLPLARWMKIGLCVGLNTGYLFFLKYIVATGLFASESTVAGNLFGALGLPLGISFITFQQIGFGVDQARGRDREPSFIRYLFFLTFFPHLVAGPIVPHRLLVPQIDRKPFMRFSKQFARVGFAYFAIGLGKKLLIAEPLTIVNNELFKATAELSMIEAWFNAFVYSFRIYFDFSAYSDMAVGLAYLMGVQFPRNFESPYKAQNIFLFWRSWHITLYAFFRQYLYVPLMHLDVFKRHVSLAILIVFFLSALWHGVGLGYLVWGLGHAALMIAVYQLGRAGVISTKPWTGFKRYAAIAFTFLCVTLLWIPFAINNVNYVGVYLGRLVSMTGSAERIHAANWALFGVAAVIAFAFPNSHQISLGGRRSWWLLPFAILVFALASPLAIGRLTPPPPFIYFQF